MGKEKEMEGQIPNHEAWLSQQPKMNKSPKAKEEDNNKIKDLNFPLNDGSRNPHSHLKEYVDKLSIIGQSDNLKMKIFVSSLKGPALIW